MSRHEIIVPRLGEGIEVVKVAIISVKVGDIVARDTALIEVETDKATHMIESPVAGTINEICCQPGSVLNVGAVMAVIGAGSGATEEDDRSARPQDTLKNDLSSIAIRKRNQVRTSAKVASEHEYADGANVETDEGSKHEFSAKQLLIARGLRDSQSIPVATIEMDLDWGRIEVLRRRLNSRVRPSGLELVAWAVVRAMQDHHRFRAVRYLTGEYRISAKPNVGIAIALPDDELAIAPVAGTEEPDFLLFVTRMRAAIQSAAEWGSASGVALVISDMSSFGVIAATPVVVAPSIATLFIGAPEWRPQRGESDQLTWGRVARLVLAFDHGLINGVGAASFMTQVIDSLSYDDETNALSVDEI